ncbi:hypothetical protein KY333_01720 [Candidatus Woesearchaeota archaeon]|nr:hypothetical protein [Candidatus Woesearchaeota archaeon]MBW2994407.1 hypothetical protein [Candidatus Woesearchaeota archaeon]
MNFQSTSIKILGGTCAVIVLLGMILAAAGVITWNLFWVIIIFGAVMAYFVIPWIKKKSQQI